MARASIQNVLVTGGAGYVGAVLVPKLIGFGFRARVIDWFIFGDHVLDAVKASPGYEPIRGDIRDERLLRQAMRGCDAVVHLACISNDPSFELNPDLGRSVNFDAFEPMVRLAKEAGVRRFIYASSSSVYGVSDQPDVTEDHPLNPMTDYSRFKAMCEPILLHHGDATFVPVVVRPATVCGYSPRQRLDLTVNILTNHAVNRGKITVFGGSQMRPNIHIADMTDLYVRLLRETDAKIAGKVWNAGYENHTVAELAQIVRRVVRQEMPGRKDVEIVTTPTDDLRSYHISARRISRELPFTPTRSIADAVRDLVDAFADGGIPNAMDDPRYCNIKTMQAVQARLAAA
jgi:nucleoside-diphosphate-sugar epimerase